ncbi:hypothetical protein CITRIK5_70693 [Citricoccus sp. K5]|nr:hypothetical protein CITRIK5_70693 [Citricoccus sp. K5]
MMPESLRATTALMSSPSAEDQEYPETTFIGRPWSAAVSTDIGLPTANCMDPFWTAGNNAAPPCPSMSSTSSPWSSKIPSATPYRSSVEEAMAMVPTEMLVSSPELADEGLEPASEADSSVPVGDPEPHPASTRVPAARAATRPRRIVGVMDAAWEVMMLP